MRRSAGSVFAACVLAGAVTMPAQATTDGPRSAAGGGGPTGSYIVVLEGDAPVRSLVREHTRTLGIDVGHVYGTALNGYSAVMSRTARDVLATLPNVAYVQPDRKVHAMAQQTPTGIDRAQADQSPTAGIDGVDERVDVDVAVIDTGVDLDHPDLNVYRQGAENCSLSLSADDDNGHGSHVSGTIGALDDNTGVVGMAPGARIWPVKVLNALGVGSTSDVICGIDYVAAHADQIEVANMSLGGSGSDDGNCGKTNGDAQHQAICNAVSRGVTFVVAAGNAYEDASTTTPAAYDEVITVSALADFNGRPGGGAPSTCRQDADDTFADFSNYGADVDLIAPGVCITSTWMNGGYNTISGTSMASPHVAGAAALYASTHPGATPRQVKQGLQGAGTDDWIWPSEDPDGTQEKLLDVSGF